MAGSRRLRSRGRRSPRVQRRPIRPRRARQPENCGKCHLGPDHPQKEVYEESKHGIAYRGVKYKMNLDGETWVLGEDYAQAPTCATCHMSGNVRNEGRITHDPGVRPLGWWIRGTSQVTIRSGDPDSRFASIDST